MWKDYLSFNRKQRNGVLVLCSLLVVMIIWLAIVNSLPPKVGNVDLNQFKVGLPNKTDLATGITDSLETNTSKGKGAATESKKIDINTCSVKELSHYPTVGYYLALAIVNYRD